MQLFGTRNIGDLSPADMLWVYKVIKKLHNGFKNAMLVDTSRNQWQCVAHFAVCDGLLHGRH